MYLLPGIYVSAFVISCGLDIGREISADQDSRFTRKMQVKLSLCELCLRHKN